MLFQTEMRKEVPSISSCSEGISIMSSRVLAHYRVKTEADVSACQAHQKMCELSLLLTNQIWFFRGLVWSAESQWEGILLSTDSSVQHNWVPKALGLLAAWSQGWEEQTEF